MQINDFISSYKNYPVIFVGTGISLRYLKNSYNWEDLLKKVAFELKGNNEFYADIRLKYRKENGSADYCKIAGILEKEFDKSLKKDRYGKFKKVNDKFYGYAEQNIDTTRFKIYIAQLLSFLQYKEEVGIEVSEIKAMVKNVSSIITTNYDCFLEEVFKEAEFKPLVGNDIILSNPYGSIYKIHGCIEQPEKIIITDKDYQNFDEKYHLIKAHLLSLFIHNPIIFIGYSMDDSNIRSILKTIFSCIDKNSDIAETIRNNFLIVEYEKDSYSTEVCQFDIAIDNSNIKVSKIKTDNYISIYKAISNLNLPVSAMDIRRVKNIIKNIEPTGGIKIQIVSDVDDLANNDKILFIGSHETVQRFIYNPTVANLINDCFKIIDSSEAWKLKEIGTSRIEGNLPIFGFSRIYEYILNADKLKEKQRSMIEKLKQIKVYQ